MCWSGQSVCSKSWGTASSSRRESLRLPASAARQNTQDKFALGFRVAEAIVAEARREVALERHVFRPRLWMGSQVVAERQVLLELIGSERTDEQMMDRRIGRTVERLASGRSTLDLAAMVVANRFQPLDRRGQIAGHSNDGVDVDDRFGGETRHRSAAHMLDAQGQGTESGCDALPDALEDGGPGGVVVNDGDGKRGPFGEFLPVFGRWRHRCAEKFPLRDAERKRGALGRALLRGDYFRASYPLTRAGSMADVRVLCA